MGRSVSRPTGSIWEEYAVHGCDDLDDEWDDEWDDFVDFIADEIMSKYPSFTRCKKWLDREDMAILENGHGYIGISEYCGIACIWGMPHDNYNNHYSFNKAGINLVGGFVSDMLRNSGIGIVKTATASNGESFYSKRVQAH